MEQPPDPRREEPPIEEPPADDLGEDHREGAPGYDLDEQRAIQELQRERSDHEQ